MNSPHSLRNLLIINFLTSVTIAANTLLGEPPAKNTQPSYWTVTTRRMYYLQTRTGHFLEICPGVKPGIRGVHQRTDHAILEQMSGRNFSVVIRGVHSKLYICMDTNSQLYTSPIISEACYFKENYHHSYNVYHHWSHRERKTKFYIGIDRLGKARKGMEARKTQKMSQFTPLDYKNDSVRSSPDCISGDLDVININSPSTKVDPEKKKREQTRKRRRRWCKHLLSGKMERNPEKYWKRCKYDCVILRQMLDNRPKYKRKCEKAKRKRKWRKKRLHKLRHKRLEVVSGQRGHRGHGSADSRTSSSTVYNNAETGV